VSRVGVNMSAWAVDAPDRKWARQALIGLLMLPLSVLPFIAYFKYTPEGRLLWAKFTVSIHPPHLPELSSADAAWARSHAPSYDGAVALLVYHGIGPSADDNTGFSISPGQFGEQLATLKAAGMHAVTAREVADAFAGRATLPPNAVMISFDDGRADAMLYADPLLKQAGMKATMFVITRAAGDPGIYYVGWDRLREYARSGRWDLESHTANSHHLQPVADGPELPALTSLAPGETFAEYRWRVTADLHTASRTLAREIGQTPVALAYPFGAHGTERTNDPGIRRFLPAAVSDVVSIAFEQDEQLTWPLATCHDDQTSLRRLEVGPWSGRTLLRKIVAAQARTRLLGIPCAA
jgi:peptidoglycan/xylan/chitin deacetylase (PgdA/CDA1 family)